MPRRKLRLTLNQGEQKTLAEIKRIHKAGSYTLPADEEREMCKHTFSMETLPTTKVRMRNGSYEFKGPGFGCWRTHCPLNYQTAKAERDYLVTVELAKIKRQSARRTNTTTHPRSVE
jgi:hypothetical protein